MIRSSDAGGALGPPEHGPDAGDELLGAERLDHVVVGAELEARDPVRLVAAGGEDDDGDGGVAADGAHDVEPVDPRQAEVEDERVRPPGAERGDRRGAVGRGEDGEPGVFEVVADEPGDLGLVLDDEDRAHVVLRDDEDAGRGYPPGVAGRGDQPAGGWGGSVGVAGAGGRLAGRCPCLRLVEAAVLVGDPLATRVARGRAAGGRVVAQGRSPCDRARRTGPTGRGAVRRRRRTGSR